jgi:hypothetical protein
VPRRGRVERARSGGRNLTLSRLLEFILPLLTPDDASSNSPFSRSLIERFAGTCEWELRQIPERFRWIYPGDLATHVYGLLFVRVCARFWRVSRNSLRSSPRNFLSCPCTSPSQAVSSPEKNRTLTPPESSPTAEPTYRKATPVFNHIRKKWCCSACNRDFRGRWECKRHIEAADRRARCVACGANLKARGDSLLRHFAKYCKGDVGDMRSEDAFAEA